MRLLKIAAVLAALAFFVCPIISAQAGATDPLFVNVTTDDAHRANMALTFSKNQFERKHPVTIFLKDRAVLLASRENGERFKHHQEMLTSFVKDGATVIICPMCMKQYGVKEADLIEGIKVGNPDLTGGALFQEGTKTLTW
jgi:sulfur relay (sulfurtransferase) complex TusBCD TusD component (DsrE family)